MLPEVVLGRKKRILLNEKLDFNAVRSDFSSLMDQIDSVLPIPANRERVYDMEGYFNPNGIQLASTIIDVSEHSDGKISGKCIGLYGDIVLFENAGQQFMFSLKKMISYQVSLSDRVEGMDFEPQQISMF